MNCPVSKITNYDEADALQISLRVTFIPQADRFLIPVQQLHPSSLELPLNSCARPSHFPHKPSPNHISVQPFGALLFSSPTETMQIGWTHYSHLCSLPPLPFIITFVTQVIF